MKDTTTTRIQNTNLSQKFRNERALKRDEIKSHNKTKNELKEAQDIIATLTTENLQLGKIIKDLRNRFITGGVIYTVNGDYVSSAIVIPPYSEWTYTQDIPKEIGTKLYSNIPFVKITNRQLTIDTKQKNKYKGALI